LDYGKFIELKAIPPLGKGDLKANKLGLPLLITEFSITSNGLYRWISPCVHFVHLVEMTVCGLNPPLSPLITEFSITSKGGLCVDKSPPLPREELPPENSSLGGS